MEKEREDRKKPAIIAHRGASLYAPENTLAAFHLAWQQGAEGIECDVHQTKDGSIVCIHDSDTSRVSQESLIVAETNLNDLKRIDIGSWKGENWKGEPVPTLDEVLQSVPEGKQIYIEIKTDKSILEAFYQILDRALCATEQISVIAFDAEVIGQLKIDRPQLKAYWLTDFKDDETGEWGPDLNQISDTLKALKADGLGAQNHEAVDQTFVDTLLQNDFDLNVWTIDDLDEARRYRDLGVTSISTNDPFSLIQDL